ncbi:MAG: BamA/TamA family outer membrane protein, partial [Planctomycetes bacterium]|nr:BamA/TamA family outer membrane protein [Planctomycetota bacterium]
TSGEWGSIVSLDAQQVVPLPGLFHRGAKGREENPPTDVLAIGAFVQDTVGELPFYSLPTLGGSRTLRGYIQNRFTDRAAAHFSVEYRVNLIERGFAFTDTIRIERIGLALFYDGGTLASDWDALDEGRYLDSYGVGLRLAFSREAVFRVDVGYGDEGSNFTIAFGNSF